MKETLNVLLLLEKTRIRNVRRTSKHFPTTKVDFLTNEVVLRIIRMVTVSRNATDDFRTESERLVYGSCLVCNFPFSGRGGMAGAREEAGGSRASRTREVRFQTDISRKRLKITLSIWY